jgi:hypothetical protein
MDAVQRTRRLVGHSGLLVHVFFKHPAAAELSDDIIGVEEASGRIAPAGSRPRSQSPHIWGQFRLGPQIAPSPIGLKNRCCSTGPCIVPNGRLGRLNFEATQCRPSTVGSGHSMDGAPPSFRLSADAVRRMPLFQGPIPSPTPSRSPRRGLWMRPGGACSGSS